MGVKAEWQKKIQNGLIDLDHNQLLVVNILDELYETLLQEQKQPQKTRLWHRFFQNTQPIKKPKGIYLWGSVGRGKSMMMDLFAAKLKENTNYKVARIHFYEFMADIQQRLVKNRQIYRAYDNPLIPLAAELSQEYDILCFDEFQVTNIADAMILGRLFKALFAHQITIIATSNVAPDDLYRNGLHRSRFLPFIDILKEHMDILEIAEGYDFRQRTDILEDAWLQPNNQKNNQKLKQLFNIQTKNKSTPCQLMVGARPLELIGSADQVAMADYNILCKEARGAADYHLLASRFHSLYLMNVPSLRAEGAAAWRFIYLIDILYEWHVCLYVLADTKMENLEPPDIDIFKRTSSRLTEMCSQNWQKNSFELWQQKRSSTHEIKNKQKD